MTETNTTNIGATGEATPPSRANEKSLLSETGVEKSGFLGRIRRAVGSLALRLMARDKGDRASIDNGSTDSENSDDVKETAIHRYENSYLGLHRR